MRSRLILIVAVLALLGCARAAGQTSVVVSCDEFAKQQEISRRVEVPAGSTFQVTLCSNPSTGFQWEEPEIAGPAVEVVEHEYVAPAGDELGAPGQETWTLKAAGQGQATIAFAYSRPWEGGEKGEWQLELVVVVK